MNSHPSISGLVFDWIWRTSYEAAVLAGLILLAQRLFRQALPAGGRHALWLLLLARLLIPVTPPSAASIFNLARVPRTPALRQAAQKAATTTGREGTFPPPPQESGAATSQAPGRAPLQSGALDWAGLAARAWICGVGLLALRLAWTHIRFRSRLAGHTPVSDPRILRILGECANQLKVRRAVTLIVTGETQSPAVCGCWNKRLLLPPGILDRFSTAELRHIFLHELAHIKRHDLEINSLAGLLQTLHWFNPVIWLAFSRMSADRELAADALALDRARAGEDVLYGETVLKVVESMSRSLPRPGLIGIAGSKARLAERFEAITRRGSNHPSRWRTVAVAVVLSAIGLTGAENQPRPIPNKSRGAEHGPSPVSAVNTQPQSSAPDLGKNEEPAAGGRLTGRRLIHQKLRNIRLPEVAFDDLPLSRVVKLLRDELKALDPEKIGVNFILMPSAAATPLSGGPEARVEAPVAPGSVLIQVNPPLTNACLEDVLRAVCRAARQPIAYTVEDYGIVFAPDNELFVVTVAKGEPYLSIKSGVVTMEALQRILSERVAKNPEVVVQIRPDKRAPIKEILKLLEAVKAAHVKSTPSLLVLPENKPK